MLIDASEENMHGNEVNSLILWWIPGPYARCRSAEKSLDERGFGGYNSEAVLLFYRTVYAVLRIYLPGK